MNINKDPMVSLERGGELSITQIKLETHVQMPFLACQLSKDLGQICLPRRTPQEDWNSWNCERSGSVTLVITIVRV